MMRFVRLPLMVWLILMPKLNRLPGMPNWIISLAGIKRMEVCTIINGCRSGRPMGKGDIQVCITVEGVIG
ncbi:hypothetical protein AUJ95_01140 [Candidatus Desantisbacteria bacterium CG2_30_40_21]|uniref:Uncharacterized protein n=3 Tax=unclassified Candidatus Desantisiibacteriota TaxID=3106372 RepID=A0A2M7JAI8_9BACT|nr:MAG: hypothetical protein AUJ95_01140 [Candidatus Desantisbacteria bacterium CG2_30_40_21]PIP39878.1 MAG: hypothetical protein COX18_08625 [Candidatus Desantisbacteria bacterium CG23_combo_of_CG06-09_8_20_14_all_40_23]PIX16420.1 MAG: hypothetical protein COZ71_07715 [Candidatus Desantisbacteria bacterium CG_4_8_14_3_um_filter_40_12]